MKKYYYIVKTDTLTGIKKYYIFSEKLESYEYDKNLAIEHVSSIALKDYYNNNINYFMSIMGYKNFKLEKVI